MPNSSYGIFGSVCPPFPLIDSSGYNLAMVGRYFQCTCYLGVFFVVILLRASFAFADGQVPGIATMVKPQVFKKAIEEREVMVHAALSDLKDSESSRTENGRSQNDSSIKKYSFYAMMAVRAGTALTRGTLTNYQLYPKMIPYVDKAQYSPITRILQVEGGIWKFKLISSVLFEEKSDRWIHFKIVGGHFRGLEGDVFFESMGERGTAVYMRGEQLGSLWPPRFVIERGAEIVFGFTARRMRSYIEELKKSGLGMNPVPEAFQELNHDSEDKAVSPSRTRLQAKSDGAVD